MNSLIRKVSWQNDRFPHFFPILLQEKTAIYSLQIYCGEKLMADREGYFLLIVSCLGCHVQLGVQRSNG